MFSPASIVVGATKRASKVLLIGATIFTSYLVYKKISELPVPDASLDWEDDEDVVIEPLEEVSTIILPDEAEEQISV